jgi:uncharacterized protein YndB with AHSA1/START domain
MNGPQGKTETSLRLTRSFGVPRERLFEAWTNPEELKNWWHLGHGWKLSVAEVDLRVGGRYRIGLASSQGEAKHTVTGTFREVSVPERLVYTWIVEDPRTNEQESIVTVEFHDKGSSTELVLKHDKLVNRESRQNTYDGWVTVLVGLSRLLG